MLALSSSPPRSALTAEQLHVTEVFAGLAAVALERAELLEHQAEQARTEELLHRAASAVTASLDLAHVYESIVEQAAIIAAAPTVILLSQDRVTQTLRAVATRGAPLPLTSRRYALTDEPGAEIEGVRSVAHVALSLGPRQFGMLAVCHPDEDAFGAAVLRS